MYCRYPLSIIGGDGFTTHHTGHIRNTITSETGMLCLQNISDYHLQKYIIILRSYFPFIAISANIATSFPRVPSEDFYMATGNVVRRSIRLTIFNQIRIDP